MSLAALMYLVHATQKQQERGIFFVCFPEILPGFGCDRVNFHKKLGGLTQTSQANRIFDTRGCSAT